MDVEDVESEDIESEDESDVLNTYVKRFNDDDMCYLVPSEGEEFKIKVSKNVMCKQSILINSMLYDNDNTESIDEEYVPLPNVSCNILKKIIEYCEYYYLKKRLPEEIERPLKSDKFEDCVSEWDAKFIDIDIDTLLELVCACNYIGTHHLSEDGVKMGASIFDLTTSKIAFIISKWEPEELKKKLCIPSEEEYKAQNKVMNIVE